MLEVIRKSLKSKIGAAIAIALLVLIALAFASGDVANTGGFGGVAGGDRAATVGDERIDTATLSQATTSALERVKEDDPTMSMKGFLARGGLESTLTNLIDRLAVAVFGQENGIVASDRLVDSEIAQMAAFRGADGKFSEDLFRQVMQQRGVSEALIRDDLRQGLIARQVMIPARAGALMPMEMVRRYAALLTETRTGQVAVLPSIVFSDGKEPTDRELADYYAKNRDDFIRPERRVIRYATFGEDVLKDIPAPTEAEIAFRYKANKDKYSAREKRRITQLVVPTEAAARAVIAEVSAGTSLEAAAQSKGLSARTLEAFSKDELRQQFSAALADAAFATAKGQVASPVRSPLGWHVLRVQDIESRPARTLDQVRAELTREIALEKKRIALSEALEGIEEGFDSGGNLAEAARTLGIEVRQTEPLTADGNVYLKAGQTIPDVLRPVLETAFSMDVEEPQLAEVERGKTFALFDVTEIEPSAPAPLAEIRDNVKAAYILEKSSVRAKAAARKVQAEMARGKSLAQALGTLGKPLPPIQAIRMSRPQLQQMQQQAGQVPPPVAMLFNMAEGTVKVLPSEGERAWFVVSLADIAPGTIDEKSPMLASARRELSMVAGSEYTDALGRAIRKQVGVKRNPDAIRAVRQQLGGTD